MTADITEADIEKARANPGSVFSSPTDILPITNLSDDLKIEILSRWEYDAREMQVADEEGFPDHAPGALFDEVLIALRSLGAIRDVEYSPPTKQGGLLVMTRTDAHRPNT